MDIEQVMRANSNPNPIVEVESGRVAGSDKDDTPSLSTNIERTARRLNCKYTYQ